MWLGHWKTFERVFSDGQEKTRYIQEIIVTDSDNDVRYWKLTKDIMMERKSTTWYLMSNLSGELHDCIGNKYGFRNWIEYGIKQAKSELGWADFRVTNYQQIEKWWEIVSCAFLLVSFYAYNSQINSQKLTGEKQLSHSFNQENHPQNLTGEKQLSHSFNQENHPQNLTGEKQLSHSFNQENHPQNLSSQEKLNTLNSAFLPQVSQESSSEPSKYSEHQWWDFSINWKSTLNNLRLIVQPYAFFNLISPWLKVFNIPVLKEGFLELINYLNLFRVGELLLQHKEEIAQLMSREMGKPLKEARGDVQEGIDCAFYSAGEGRRLFGQTTPSEMANKFAMTMRMPVGVCATIWLPQVKISKPKFTKLNQKSVAR